MLINSIVKFVRNESSVFILTALVPYCACVNVEPALRILCDATEIILCILFRKHQPHYKIVLRFHTRASESAYTRPTGVYREVRTSLLYFSSICRCGLIECCQFVSMGVICVFLLLMLLYLCKCDYVLY